MVHPLFAMTMSVHGRSFRKPSINVVNMFISVS
jgi:hypothetical protein